jgi:hypothetical protein
MEQSLCRDLETWLQSKGIINGLFQPPVGKPLAEE